MEKKRKLCRLAEISEGTNKFGEPRTEWGKHQRKYCIRQSRERINAASKGTVMQEGDNFRFVSWDDLTELKLWEKR